MQVNLRSQLHSDMTALETAQSVALEYLDQYCLPGSQVQNGFGRHVRMHGESTNKWSDLPASFQPNCRYLRALIVEFDPSLGFNSL